MNDLLRDLRFAIRSLTRRKGFTAVALLTLTLGIGANTAVFSVVRSVLLRPLPYAEPDRLVRFHGTNTRTGASTNLSPADFLDFQRESRTFARMGAHGWIGPATVSNGQGNAERIGRVEVTEGFLPTLGVQPALGRFFTSEEDMPGAEPVAVLSHGLWQRMFGADPEIIGRRILVNAVPATVIGVLPADFRHVEERTDRTAEIFTPFRFDPVSANRGGHFIRGVGRLAPGSTLADARAELTTIAARLEEQHPTENTNQGVVLTNLHDDIVGDTRVMLLVLLGAAGFVLLIACANLGNLLLAVGTSRERELAVRAAVGAGRGRIVRQLLAESLVLGVLGGSAGLLAANAATGTLRGLAAAGIPRAGDISVDLGVLAFTSAAAIIATALFGLLPALALSSRAPGVGVVRGERTGVDTVTVRSRSALIAGEVALSVVLLAGAGLLIATLLELRPVPTGFQPERAIATEIAPPTARYPEGTQIPFHDEVGQRIRALPGVTAAGAVNILPLTANYDSRAFLIDDQPMPLAGEAPSAEARSATPGYFEAMGIPLLRGRLFDERDHQGAPLVAVISQSMAQRYWPGEDPIGKRFTYNSGIPDEENLAACPGIEPYFCVGGPGSREIIGVVGDVKHLELGEVEAVPMFYTPNTQPPSYHAMTWIIRTEGDPLGVVGALRAAVTEIDPEVPLGPVVRLEDVVAQTVAQPMVRAGLVGLFAALAVLLAWIGVYGVVGYLVTRRTHEIGVRIALGATSDRLLRMLAIDGLRPVLVGIAIGIPTALALSRLLEGMLFGVSPAHPLVYVVACATLMAAGLVAALLPARRALSVDPAASLDR